jgi:Fic family protein
VLTTELDNRTSTETALSLAAAAQRNLSALDLLWGRACIGLALVHAYHLDGWPRSAAEIARLAGVSDDTASRYLRKLANIGRVEASQAVRGAMYTATPKMAERTTGILSSWA